MAGFISIISTDKVSNMIGALAQYPVQDLAAYLKKTTRFDSIPLGIGHQSLEFFLTLVPPIGMGYGVGIMTANYSIDEDTDNIGLQAINFLKRNPLLLGLV